MAWIYQDEHQVKKHGPEKAAHYVGWIDPEGKKRCKSCGPGAQGLRNAEKFKTKVEAELLTGTYQSNVRKTWEEFRKEYEEKVLEGMNGRTRGEALLAINHFQAIIKPKRMQGISNKTLADFVATRRTERGLKADSIVSPATVNKELRHLRSALRKAVRWGYLAKQLDFDFIKEAKKLPTYVTPEDFARIYAACDNASLPSGLPFQPGDWWRGLLVTAYLTGWRIGQLLALRREDVNLEEGTALTRAEDNKGKRDQKITLHPVVVEHLGNLVGFTPCFFPWPHARRLLWVEFERIQKQAQVKLTGTKDHYTPHDLRRGFATMNADRLTPDMLQTLMQHKDYQTTQKYINLARQLRPAAQNLFVPELPRKGTA
jgi:integrase